MVDLPLHLIEDPISELDDKLFELIIDEMYKGFTATKAAQMHNVKPKAFRMFAEGSPARLTAMSHAQEAQADAVADAVLEIADTETDQLRSRNRIDARKWHASKTRPAKYGDRIELNINKVVDISGALAEAVARSLPPRDSEQVNQRDVIEISATNTNNQSGYEPDEAPIKNESHDIFS